MGVLPLLVIFNYLGANVIYGYLALPRPEFDLDTIVGGQNASIEDHPYQVSFTVKDDDIILYYCAGFIVSQDYILSAAHCTNGVNASSVEIRAGSTWHGKGTIIPIAKVITNPDFMTLNVDVGILKTAKPIQFSDTIQPVKLPDKGKILEDGSMVIVAGWGTTSDRRYPGSEHLMAVEVPVVNFYKCKKAYLHDAVVTSTMWCAGYLNAGGKDACQGDSGGAAVQDGVAVGIVSFGIGCGRPGFPGVYTNLAAPDVRDFISKETGL